MAFIFIIGLFMFCYSLYLLNYLEQVLHINTGSSQFLAAAIATLVGFLISILSFYFFEMPFLKLKKYFR
jgi:peptidoglycan/LPS O-acetylase OafA/YrhL